MQGKRYRVDAVAQPTRRRAVGEDVAKVGITVAAEYLSAHHAMGAVLDHVHGPWVHRGGETRPPRAGLELGVRAEQRLVTAAAVINPALLAIGVYPAACWLGAFQAAYPVLLRVQLVPPLGVRLVDFCAQRMRLSDAAAVYRAASAS